MTLDASGNLGVGGTAGTAKIYAIVASSGSDVSAFDITNGANASFAVKLRTDVTTIGAGGTGNMVFATGGSLTERARITSGGDLLVGTTSNTPAARINVASSGVGLNVEAVTVSGAFKSANSGNETVQTWNSATTGNNTFAAFYTETVAATRGSITYNRAGGLVAYNTTSDYRAKDILGPVLSPGATIDALKVYEGVMKGATQSRPMLVAHEAQAVTPYAVLGIKDEVNEDGSPKFQQMDHASLVPLLIAEIQSLRARVAALEQA